MYRGRGGGGYGRGGGGGGGGYRGRGGGGGYGGYGGYRGGRGGGGGGGDDHHHTVKRSREGSTREALAQALHRMDRGSYPMYKDLIGEWYFDEFTFLLDHVQADPFAPPSRCRVRVPLQHARFPKELHSTRIRTTAFCDYLTRMFWAEANRERLDVKAAASGWHGSKGGDVSIEKPGQHVLERTSVLLIDDAIEARFTVALPARGRSIEGIRAAEILCDALPPTVVHALFARHIDVAHLKEHVLSVEDQEYLRSQALRELGLTAFVANGSILPRRSGVDDRPMSREEAQTFVTPDSMRVEIKLLSGRVTTGMGIRNGISLIVGGGFHGKSTLLEALEVGVYNHVPGDGREFVCTDASAVKIRAEDGRCVTSVDISPFINNLPYKKSTKDFSTPDASGSTSQAANIVEAIQAGAQCMLVDEDTCATNFMIRDRRMQELVAANKEPITPFISRVRMLYEVLGISTILVIGGAGDYFDVADEVIMMDAYKPYNVTKRAREICARLPTEHLQSIADPSILRHIEARAPARQAVLNVRSRGRGRVSAMTQEKMEFGETEVDLSAVMQVVEKAQTRAIGDCIVHAAEKFMSDSRPLPKVLDWLEHEMDEHGLDGISMMNVVGTLARPRRFEIAAALNRLRGARFIHTV